MVLKETNSTSSNLIVTLQPNPLNSVEVNDIGLTSCSDMVFPSLSMNFRLNFFPYDSATLSINSSIVFKSYVILSSFRLKRSFQLEHIFVSLGNVKSFIQYHVAPSPLAFPYAEHTVFWQCLWKWSESQCMVVVDVSSPFTALSTTFSSFFSQIFVSSMACYPIFRLPYLPFHAIVV